MIHFSVNPDTMRVIESNKKPSSHLHIALNPAPSPPINSHQLCSRQRRRFSLSLWSHLHISQIRVKPGSIPDCYLPQLCYRQRRRFSISRWSFSGFRSLDSVCIATRGQRRRRSHRRLRTRVREDWHAQRIQRTQSLGPVGGMFQSDSYPWFVRCKTQCRHASNGKSHV